MEHALFREYPAAWLDLPLPRLVWGGSKSRVLLKAPPVVLGGHGVYGGTVTSPNRHGGISRTHTASHILGPLSSGGSCPSPYCKPRNASKLSNPTPYRKRLKHSHLRRRPCSPVYGVTSKFLYYYTSGTRSFTTRIALERPKDCLPGSPLPARAAAMLREVS